MIQRLRGEGIELPVERACGLLGLPRSLYCYVPRVVAQSETTEAVRLREAIEQISLEFPGYGYRRVTAQLHRDGWAVNHKRVLRVMHEESLLCHLQRRWTPTTDSAHGWTVYPNRLQDACIDGLNQAWLADMTYIRLPTSFAYLAALLDAYSRKVVGWCLSRSLEAGVVLTALERALAERHPSAGWIHHSDRGVQYACRDYVERLEAAQAHISMSAKGCPRENAQAESFFRTLKMEEVYLQDYQSFREAEASIGHFLEAVYNQKRLHSALGCRPPSEFEALVAAGLL